MMQALVRKRLCSALFRVEDFPYLHIHSRSLITLNSLLHPQVLRNPPTESALARGVFISPWSVIQERSNKCMADDVRAGDVIRRKGRILVVVSSRHNQRSRGSATMQVELRDLVNDTKVEDRFRTTETIETVYVESKNCTYVYTDGKNVVLSETSTGEQIEVSKDLFGKAAVYLKEDLPVTLKLYDEEVKFATIPNRVNCMVVDPNEESDIGLSYSGPSTSTSRYKRVLLDNGLTVSVPPFVEPGDEVVIKTEDNTYFSKA